MYLETNIIRQNEQNDESAGERNHENIITPNFPQSSDSAPVYTTPAPSNAPITVCVPEIGIFEKVDVIIKKNDEKHTANIIIFCDSAD